MGTDREREKIFIAQKNTPVDPKITKTSAAMKRIGGRDYSPDEVLRVAAVLNRRTRGFERMRAAMTGQVDELTQLRQEFPELRPLFDTFERKK